MVVVLGSNIRLRQGLVLGPSTALCRPFLKHCNLTNKAIGTIWRALSKPFRRRQGPYSRPLLLYVGTPSAFAPALEYRLRVHGVAKPALMDVPIYFWYTIILLYMLVCHILLPLRFGRLSVLSLYKEDYLQIFKCLFFWLHGCWG